MTKGDEFMEALERYHKVREPDRRYVEQEWHQSYQALRSIVDEIWDAANHSHAHLAVKPQEMGELY